MLVGFGYLYKFIMFFFFFQKTKIVDLKKNQLAKIL